MFTQLVIGHKMSDGRERDLLTIREKFTGLSFLKTDSLLAGSSASIGKVQAVADLQI